jgi:hypothetical protein
METLFVGILVIVIKNILLLKCILIDGVFYGYTHAEIHYSCQISINFLKT